MLFNQNGFGNIQALPPVPVLRPSQAIYSRAESLTPEDHETLAKVQGALARGEGFDFNSLAPQVASLLAGMGRSIVTTMTAFPVRENLEAVAKMLIPTETPLRNRLPRTPGSGLASKWNQITSFGGGWGSTPDQPGGGGSASQVFFAETGAPATLTSVYAQKTASYKLMGEIGGVSGFAMAAGANYQNQLAIEKRNALLNAMLNEENALVNGSSTSTAAPWGDGTNALAYDGLINLTTTANGVPSAQIQTSVGALTFAHIDAQLSRIWTNGGRRMFMLLNQQEIRSIRNLASNASNGLYKIVATGEGNTANVGLGVTGYVHPITGEIVEILASKFVPAGTMLFGSMYLPDGSPALDVDVLPQTMLPELAPNEFVQGYTAQEIAPSITAPQLFSFIVSVYSVLRMKGATVFAKSTGVTAV